MVRRCTTITVNAGCFAKVVASPGIGDCFFIDSVRLVGSSGSSDANATLMVRQSFSREYVAICRFRRAVRACHPRGLVFALRHGRIEFKSLGSCDVEVVGSFGSRSSLCPSAGLRTIFKAKASHGRMGTLKRQAVKLEDARVVMPASTLPVRKTASATAVTTESATRSSVNVRGWNLTYVEQTGERLERHTGAARDSRPAWMTKGLGVGAEMFGKQGTGKDELLKPGLTRGDLEELERRPNDLSSDPFAEVFREMQSKGK